MPVSKAQQKAVYKYVAANYDEIKLRVPKGDRDRIKAHADTRGESVNGFILRAIRAQMQRDAGEMERKKRK
nr:MAG TPA: Alginate and motility regulator [Caudoviricetes sp.]